MPFIPVAEYRPDTAQLNNGFTGDVSNVLCADGSYIPFPSASVFSSALAAVPLGAFMARDLSGTISIFAGTAAKLWKLNNTTLAWDDVSQAATTYTANADSPWSFAQYGTYVVAVNANDDPQVFNLSSSTEFADLGGSPPRAKAVRVWGDFLVLQGLTANPDRVHWSGLDDIEQWTPGTNNSDYQTFPDGGAVQGSSQATNPIIFLERAIWLGTFVPGSLEIFSFQKIHERRGAKSQASIASRGALAFYADEGGFFQIGSDGSLLGVGFEKIDRTVFGELEASEIAKLRGVVDPFYSRVYWGANFAESSGFDRLLVYDWSLQRWTQATVSLTLLFPAATPGYTLDGLDAVSSSLDALTASLDAKVWQGGAPLLAGFDRSYQLVFFTGTAMEATITTQEMGDTAGSVSRISEIMPVVDTDSVYVSIGSRLRRSDTVTWTSEGTPSTNTGRVKKMARSRFHRVKMRVPAETDWTHIQGVHVDTAQAGRR